MTKEAYGHIVNEIIAKQKNCGIKTWQYRTFARQLLDLRRQQDYLQSKLFSPT